MDRNHHEAHEIGFSAVFKSNIRELKATRHRPQRERHLKMYFAFLQSFLNYSKSFPLQSVLTILELNWNQRFRIKHLSSYGHVVHTTAKIGHSISWKEREVYDVVQKWKVHVQSVQNYIIFFLQSNMQICNVLVAVVVVVVYKLPIC